MVRGLPPAVREFLYRHFDSPFALEVLLLLVEGDEPWTAARLAARFGLGEEAALDVLVSLSWRGFLSYDRGSGEFRYVPRTEELAKAVNELTQCPVSRLLAEIETYAAPRSFADAFQFKARRKKDPEDG